MATKVEVGNGAVRINDRDVVNLRGDSESAVRLVAELSQIAAHLEQLLAAGSALISTDGLVRLTFNAGRFSVMKARFRNGAYNEVGSYGTLADALMVYQSHVKL